MDAGLRERLVCPVTRKPLRWDATADELISDVAGLGYPVRDGVPVLLAEAARSSRHSTTVQPTIIPQSRS